MFNKCAHSPFPKGRGRNIPYPPSDSPASLHPFTDTCWSPLCGARHHTVQKADRIALFLPQVLGSSELGGPDWVPAGNTAETKAKHVPALTELFQSWGDVKQTSTWHWAGTSVERVAGWDVLRPCPTCMNPWQCKSTKRNDGNNVSFSSFVRC